jgi:hypothetical protein
MHASNGHAALSHAARNAFQLADTPSDGATDYRACRTSGDHKATANERILLLQGDRVTKFGLT